MISDNCFCRSCCLPTECYPVAPRKRGQNPRASTGWGVLPHNCVAFCESVMAAGGGTWSSHSNCPTVATADTVQERARSFRGTLENEIYQLYGVPH